MRTAPPTETQLRAGESASWGGAPRPKLEVLSFKPMRRNMLVGFVTLRFASGLKPNDCPVHVHPNGRAWCAAQREHAAKRRAERQRRRKARS